MARGCLHAGCAAQVEELQKEVVSARDLAERRLAALNKAIGERDRMEAELASLRGGSGAGISATLSQVLQYQKAAADSQEDLQALQARAASPPPAPRPSPPPQPPPPGMHSLLPPRRRVAYLYYYWTTFQTPVLAIDKVPWSANMLLYRT